MHCMCCETILHISGPLASSFEHFLKLLEDTAHVLAIKVVEVCGEYFDRSRGSGACSSDLTCCDFAPPPADVTHIRLEAPRARSEGRKHCFCNFTPLFPETHTSCREYATNKRCTCEQAASVPPSAQR